MIWNIFLTIAVHLSSGVPNEMTNSGSHEGADRQRCGNILRHFSKSKKADEEDRYPGPLRE